MRVFLNKEHLSYYQLKKNFKKHRDAPKLGRNWSKLSQIEKNW